MDEAHVRGSRACRSLTHSASAVKEDAPVDGVLSRPSRRQMVEEPPRGRQEGQQVDKIDAEVGSDEQPTVRIGTPAKMVVDRRSPRSKQLRRIRDKVADAQVEAANAVRTTATRR